METCYKERVARVLPTNCQSVKTRGITLQIIISSAVLIVCIDFFPDPSQKFIATSLP